MAMGELTVNNSMKKAIYEPDGWHWISVWLPDLFT